MDVHDDELRKFEAEGAAPLPAPNDQGYIEHQGARIWYSTFGSGSPVILLHGGLGHSGNWGYQVPALVGSGYHAVLIDSRGHGRSTRGEQPLSYELMASDVLAVMHCLHLERAALVGWSDGACTALVFATQSPSRVAGVLFFACNMDPSITAAMPMRAEQAPFKVIGSINLSDKRERWKIERSKSSFLIQACRRLPSRLVDVEDRSDT